MVRFEIVASPAGTSGVASPSIYDVLGIQPAAGNYWFLKEVRSATSGISASAGLSDGTVLATPSSASAGTIDPPAEPVNISDHGGDTRTDSTALLSSLTQLTLNPLPQ